MHGYRDHCIREAYPSAPQFYCPYSRYQRLCPYYGYRQKEDELPSLFQTPPKTPPPNYIPKLSDAASPATSKITACTFKNSYLWLVNGDSFWAYIVYVGTKSVTGWKYKGGQWVQFALLLNKIKNFACS